MVVAPLWPPHTRGEHDASSVGAALRGNREASGQKRNKNELIAVVDESTGLFHSIQSVRTPPRESERV